MTRPLLLTIALVCALLVWRDARRAGLARAWLWGLAVFGFWVVMLPVYIWLRVGQHRHD